MATRERGANSERGGLLIAWDRSIGATSRRKMEMDVLVPRQPAVIFGLVSIEIVQDHMDLAASMIGNQAVHEIEELDTPAALIMAGLDQAAGNIERGEQGGGPVTFRG
jgi:hypothetical protein